MTAISPSTERIQNQLDRFHLTLLKFTLQARGAITLPAFAGSTFRGALGGMFRRLCCASSCEDARSCLLASACPYARIFEAIPEVKDYRPANEGGLPRPFIIHPPVNGAPASSGQQISFHLVLVGNGATYLPYFIMAWRELGRLGIGRDGGRFLLQQVESRLSLEAEEDPAPGATPDAAPDVLDSAAHGPSADRQSGQGTALIYSARDELMRHKRESITVERLRAASGRLQSLFRTASGESSQLTVELVTPVRLKSGGEFLRVAPRFEVFLGALLRRLESLSFLYCERSLELDYQLMLAQAREVRTTSSELRWVEWERHSRRQNRRIPWGGLLGHVKYYGNFAPFLPFLALGELVGVGNNCAFGLGRYTVLVDK